MDELDLISTLNKAVKTEEEQEEEQEEFVLATVAEVTSTGVKLTVDGAGAAGEKEYKVNSMQKLAAGDRVKICKNSGTYLVEYKIGAPMADYPIPAGGTSGQLLAKDGSTDYTLKWVDAPDEVHGIPSGGTAGQALVKTTNTNYSVQWSTINEVPSSGTTGHVLTKTASGYGWAAAPTELPSGGSTGQVLTKTASGCSWSAVPETTPTKLQNGNYSVTLSSGVLTPSTSSYTVSLGSNSNKFLNLYTSGDCYICGTGKRLSFFGQTGATRQTVANSATVATLITALKAYGLIA